MLLVAPYAHLFHSAVGCMYIRMYYKLDMCIRTYITILTRAYNGNTRKCRSLASDRPRQNGRWPR